MVRQLVVVVGACRAHDLRLPALPGRPPARRRAGGRSPGRRGAARGLAIARGARARARSSDYQGSTNPIGIDGGCRRTSAELASRASLLIVARRSSRVASLVVRYRRSRGDERQQIKWIALRGVLRCAIGARRARRRWRRSRGVTADIALLAARRSIAIPVAIGVAILRYRLYDVDRVISRTLVYGALTVILGAAYAGLVLAGQAVFSSFAGGSNLAIAVSTLVVAALFLPLRSRVQRFVDRRFYRRRYDAQRTLEAFGARLREQVDLEALARRPARRRRRDDAARARVALAPRRGTRVSRAPRRFAWRSSALVGRDRVAAYRRSSASRLGHAATHARPSLVLAGRRRAARSSARSSSSGGRGNPIGWLFCSPSALLAATPGLPATRDAARARSGRRAPTLRRVVRASWFWIAAFGAARSASFLLFPDRTRCRRPLAALRGVRGGSSAGRGRLRAGVDAGRRSSDYRADRRTRSAIAGLGDVEALLGAAAGARPARRRLAAAAVARRALPARRRASSGSRSSGSRSAASRSPCCVAFVVRGVSTGARGLGVAVLRRRARSSIPVAVGVAILRYRLYDVDRLISRTLVYGALTVLLGAAYAGLVLAGQAVFSSFAGGSNLAIAVSTLVVAALFLPLRSRVQRRRRPALLPAPLRRAAHARGVRRAAARAGRARRAARPTCRASSARRCSRRTSRSGSAARNP